ncbi:MAG: hypothetical protein AABX84_03030, partial [Nanoarchaeota archaeon]
MRENLPRKSFYDTQALVLSYSMRARSELKNENFNGAQKLVSFAYKVLSEFQDNLNFLDLVAKIEDEFIFSRLPTNQHRIYVGKLLKHI